MTSSRKDRTDGLPTLAQHLAQIWSLGDSIVSREYVVALEAAF